MNKNDILYCYSCWQPFKKVLNAVRNQTVYNLVRPSYLTSTRLKKATDIFLDKLSLKQNYSLMILKRDVAAILVSNLENELMLASG